MRKQSHWEVNFHAPYIQMDQYLVGETTKIGNLEVTLILCGFFLLK